MLAEPVQGALRLAAVSRQARALGLGPGLTLADASARIPYLVAVDHDPAADALLLGRLAEGCDRWTPHVALDPPDGLLLDVTGCDHLVGGEAALRETVVRTIQGARLHLRATLAGTPDTARALARFGRATVVPPGHDEAAARPLPIACLTLPETTRAALALSGLKRLADLADLPSRPLAARFGEDLTRRLHRVLGREEGRITPLRPVPAVSVERAYAEPIAHAGAIEAGLRELIGRAAGLLDAAGRGGRTFEASFFRSDGSVRRIAVETGRPVREAVTILSLLRERLDALADPLDPGYGFDLVRLCVPVAEPLRPLQTGLHGDETGEDAFGDLVDRLVARLGPSRVLRFAAWDSHDPLRSSQMVPAHGVSGEPWPVPEPGEPPTRPLRLFDPPHPIEALAEVPDGPPLRFRWRRVQHVVVLAEGPERIAAEWWRRPMAPSVEPDAGPARERAAYPAPTRDYYRVEDVEGRRFWLFRAGLYGREAGHPRWFLHGLFA